MSISYFVRLWSICYDLIGLGAGDHHDINIKISDEWSNRSLSRHRNKATGCYHH